jgi:glycosyltransferase involved in cell wall biosynthesis
MLDTTENESLVHRARNLSVARFMYKSNADFFLFVDADVHFDPEAVLRLMASGHDVSCAIYPKKVVMWEQAEQAARNGDSRNLNNLSASLVMNFKYQNTQVVNGFAEVLDGPTGFLMIKRNVFTRMFEKYPELNCKNDHQNRDLDDYCAVFDCMIDPQTRRYLSEDYAFCRRWQQMGGQIFADVQTTLGHVGNIRFSGRLEDRIAVQ